MIDITKFCSHNDLREWMRQPFSVEGWSAATDGSAFIAVPINLEASYARLSEPVCDRIVKLINKINRAYQWTKVARGDVTFPDLVECKTCQGTGKATKTECPECLGEGETSASNDFNTYYDLRCGSCDGTGHAIELSGADSCPDCIGNGKRHEELSFVDLLGIRAQTKYLELIIDEPGIEVSADTEANMLMFRTSCAIGAIMCR